MSDALHLPNLGGLPAPNAAVLLVACVVLATPTAVAAGPVTDASAAAAADTGTTAIPAHESHAVPDDANASVTAWRVPHYVDAASATADELARYHDSHGGEFVTVTPTDRLAVAVRAPGLDALAANQSGNRTERVLAALNASGHLSLRQTIESTGTSQLPASLWVNASNVRALDAGDDRYVLVLDPAKTLETRAGEFLGPEGLAAAYANDPDQFSGLFRFGGDAFTVRYYENDSRRGLVAESNPVRFPPATVDLDADGPLVPGANATVAGTTTLAPGTEIEVTASTDGGDPVATEVVTVDENGTFAATLALSEDDAPATVSFTAAAEDYDADVEVSRASVRVLKPEATVAFDDQTTSTRYVAATANLSHGGFLVLRNETGVVATSGALSSAVGQTVTFTLPEDAANGTYSVVAYRGTPDDPGTWYGNAIATGRLTVDRSGSDEGTTTATTRTTTASTTGSAPTLRPRSSTADAPIPGFGVPIAVVALAATLVGFVLARGRRES